MNIPNPDKTIIFQSFWKLPENTPPLRPAALEITWDADNKIKLAQHPRTNANVSGSREARPSFAITALIPNITCADINAVLTIAPRGFSSVEESNIELLTCLIIIIFLFDGVDSTEGLPLTKKGWGISFFVLFSKIDFVVTLLLVLLCRRLLVTLSVTIVTFQSLCFFRHGLSNCFKSKTKKWREF